MAGRKVSEQNLNIRKQLVEALVGYTKDAAATGSSEEDVAEMTKQVQRVSKFFGLVKSNETN